PCVRPRDWEVVLRRGEMEWVSRMQRALQGGRFVLRAQEIHSVGDQSPRENHYELLVRMLDEHDKIVPPMAFIPAAERYNMMPMIDQWVIQDAFAKINCLGSRGGAGRPYAINIPGSSLGGARFLDFVREQFRRCVM